jgi:hypothetical protein
MCLAWHISGSAPENTDMPREFTRKALRNAARRRATTALTKYLPWTTPAANLTSGECRTRVKPALSKNQAYRFAGTVGCGGLVEMCELERTRGDHKITVAGRPKAVLKIYAQLVGQFGEHARHVPATRGHYFCLRQRTCMVTPNVDDAPSVTSRHTLDSARR